MSYTCNFFVSYIINNYDCHMNFVICLHLFDTLDFRFVYFINEHVTNVAVFSLCHLNVLK